MKGLIAKLLGSYGRDREAALTPTPAAPTPSHPREMRVSQRALALAASKPAGRKRAQAFAELFPLPPPPPFMAKEDQERVTLAMDEQITAIYGWASWGSFGEGLWFQGYAYLSELTQRGEYRLISEIRAEEMTRKWIELTYEGKTDETPKLKTLNEALKRHAIREKFRLAAEQDGFFGRSQIFIDINDSAEDPNELKTKLVRKKAKIRKGSKVGFRVVEPLWTYPNAYNAADPLLPDFFRPESWFVQAKLVHRTRLMMFVSRPLPDILKPSYAFGGLSLSQMAKPYVDNWLRTRQSVSDLVHAFSTMILATDMGATLTGGGGDELYRRVDLFNATRDNRGTMVIDKEAEEMSNVAVPLGTLDALQAQSQEQMAAISKTPLVKLLGITPSGLNASTDGEIRVFYDGINALQENMFREPMTDVLEILQLVELGEIDPKIGFKFIDLWQLDEAGQALVRKTDADIDSIHVDMGAISPEEVRAKLAADPNSPYAGLDPDDIPDPPDLGGGGEGGGGGAKPGTAGDPAKQAEPRSELRSGDAAFDGWSEAWSAFNRPS